VGDRLSFQEEIAEISPEKTTRVGAGRFVTSTITYRNQGGEIVSRQNNTLFRYFARTAGGGPE
jgi:uncharacterized protein